MEDKNFIEIYFDEQKSFTKESAQELLNKYNKNILLLTDELTGIQTTKRQLAIDTIMYFTTYIEDTLKSLIDTSHNTTTATSSQLLEMLTTARNCDYALIYLYLADINLNENKLLPDEALKPLQSLQEEAEREVEAFIVNITQDEVIARSFEINRMANQLSIQAIEQNRDADISEFSATKRIYGDYACRLLKTRAFEEEYFSANTTLEEQPSKRKINHSLFTREYSKEEIIRDILMPMSSFKEQTDFIYDMLREIEAYLPIRENNMIQVMLAIADIAEWEIDKLVAKMESLTEEDSIKATILQDCKKAEREIMNMYENIYSKYSFTYHPGTHHPVLESSSHIRWDIASEFRNIRMEQAKRMFSEIREKSNERDKIIESFRTDFPINNIENAPNSKREEVCIKTQEIEKQIEELINNYANQERKGCDIFL